MLYCLLLTVYSICIILNKSIKYRDYHNILCTMDITLSMYI